MDCIVCNNLVKKINNKFVLNDVSFSLSKGQIISLIGPNGAGKTTSFSVLCGLIKPDSGSVILNDKDITNMPMYKRARLGIGYLPQESSIFRGLSVEDNILAVLEINSHSKSECNEILENLLKELSIESVRKISAVSLSGGERRKLEIARTLAMDPDFILLDEPFAGIDPLAIADMKNMIKFLKKKNIGVIITDHNVRDALPISDYTYLLHEGRVLLSGKPEDVINNEIAQKIYLGESFSSYK